MKTNYVSSIQSYKNVAHVLGEGEGSARVSEDVGTETGLLRRELYVDARDLQSENISGNYHEELKTRGVEKLNENGIIESFNGDVDAFTSYIFGVNYTIGDIVEIENEYGLTSKMRITEIIRSQDSNGFEVCPTFSII